MYNVVANRKSGLYSSTIDCVRKVMLHEGVFAFFRGLEATLWRHAMWNGGYFGTIHYVRNQEILRQVYSASPSRLSRSSKGNKYGIL